MAWQAWWGIDQWAAYLERMTLPVKSSSKKALIELESAQGEQAAPREYASLMLRDPLLALMLLKAANERLPRHLNRDITTPLGVVLALGVNEFRRLLESAPVADPDNQGFITCERRASRSARIALAWGALHYDLDTGELALAALLSNCGEIGLWAFAPELPLKAWDEKQSGRARRSEQAQMQSCGFSFKALTLRLIEDWNLPQLIRQLIRGDETPRAQLARLAVDCARHLDNGPRDAALPHDAREAARLTGASIAAVVQAMPLLGEEDCEWLIDAAMNLSQEDPPVSE